MSLRPVTWQILILKCDPTTITLVLTAHTQMTLFQCSVHKWAAAGGRVPDNKFCRESGRELWRPSSPSQISFYLWGGRVSPVSSSRPVSCSRVFTLSPLHFIVTTVTVTSGDWMISLLKLSVIIPLHHYAASVWEENEEWGIDIEWDGAEWESDESHFVRQ